MGSRRTLTAAVIALLLTGCVPMPSETAPERNAERDLIVFVGQRLSVIEQPAEPDVMDQKFEARYRVLQLVFGKYDGEELVFAVYDHYGFPRFSRFDTALLFVVRDEGKFFHSKYQFFEVYPTQDGRWAGCGDPYKYEPDVHRGDLQPIRIEFAVGANTNGAPCTEGNYVEDLFTVKRNGVLKARGWFK